MYTPTTIPSQPSITSGGPSVYYAMEHRYLPVGYTSSEQYALASGGAVEVSVRVLDAIPFQVPCIATRVQRSDHFSFAGDKVRSSSSFRKITNKVDVARF